MYKIEYAAGVADDLAELRAYDCARILDALEAQLANEPTRETRSRKILVGLVPPWEHVDPIWELRIGEFRVFYDVDAAAAVVSVRAIRRKPPHKMTEEIL